MKIGDYLIQTQFGELRWMPVEYIMYCNIEDTILGQVSDSNPLTITMKGLSGWINIPFKDIETAHNYYTVRSKEEMLEACKLLVEFEQTGNYDVYLEALMGARQAIARMQKHENPELVGQ